MKQGARRVKGASAPRPRTLAEFCKVFGQEPPAPAVRIGPRWFYDPNGLIASARERGWEPFSGGVYLGEERGQFQPTSALVAMLGEKGGPCVALEERAAWLFLCGRDILMEGVARGDEHPAGTIVFVTDLAGNILGYGMVLAAFDAKKHHAVFVKHLLDRGEYLRRER